MSRRLPDAPEGVNRFDFIVKAAKLVRAQRQGQYALEAAGRSAAASARVQSRPVRETTPTGELIRNGEPTPLF